MQKPFVKMAKADSTPGKTRSRKKGAPKRRAKAVRRRRLAAAKKDMASDPESPPASVGRLERTRRLLLAALRVWELKRRLRD
jgi:hypothetical protein